MLSTFISEFGTTNQHHTNLKTAIELNERDGESEDVRNIILPENCFVKDNLSVPNSKFQEDLSFVNAVNINDVNYANVPIVLIETLGSDTLNSIEFEKIINPDGGDNIFFANRKTQASLYLL